MQITYEMPKPVLGQKVYIGPGDGHVGGLATIQMIKGCQITVAEVPGTTFPWESLVRNQIEYVKLFGGMRAQATRHRRVG